MIFWLVPVALLILAISVALAVSEGRRRPPLAVIDPFELVNNWPLARLIPATERLERLLQTISTTTVDRSVLEQISRSWSIKRSPSRSNLLAGRLIGPLAIWRLVSDGSLQSIVLGPPEELMEFVGEGDRLQLISLAKEAKQAGKNGFLYLALAERRLSKTVDKPPSDHQVVGAILAEANIDNRTIQSIPRSESTRVLTALPVGLAIWLADRFGLKTDTVVDGNELMKQLNNQPLVVEEQLNRAKLIARANPAIRHLAIRSWSAKYRPVHYPAKIV